MDFPSHIPFVHDLGLELLVMQDGLSELRFAPQERHLNSFRMAHGGTVMTLLDVGMALAARSTVPQEAMQSTGAVTVEMKSSFLRPGDGVLQCHAKVLHRTATLAFCEGNVCLANGTLVAHGTGTFKFVRAVASQDRRIQPVQPAQAPPA